MKTCPQQWGHCYMWWRACWLWKWDTEKSYNHPSLFLFIFFFYLFPWMKADPRGNWTVYRNASGCCKMFSPQYLFCHVLSWNWRIFSFLVIPVIAELLYSEVIGSSLFTILHAGTGLEGLTRTAKARGHTRLHRLFQHSFHGWTPLQMSATKQCILSDLLSLYDTSDATTDSGQTLAREGVWLLDLGPRPTSEQSEVWLLEDFPWHHQLQLLTSKFPWISWIYFMDYWIISSRAENRHVVDSGS